MKLDLTVVALVALGAVAYFSLSKKQDTNIVVNTPPPGQSATSGTAPAGAGGTASLIDAIAHAVDSVFGGIKTIQQTTPKTT